MHKGIRIGIWVLAAALALAGTAASAQGPKPDKPKKEAAPGPGKGPGPRLEPDRHIPSSEELLERLSDALKLSEDQQHKIKAVLDESRPEMEKLETEMKSLHERMKKAMFRAKESIREMLDMDQKERFDGIAMQIMMTRRQHMTTGRRGMGGPMMGPGMRERGPEGPMLEERERRRELRPEAGPDRPEAPPHEAEDD